MEEKAGKQNVGEENAEEYIGKGQVIGKRAPNFHLNDHNGKVVELNSVINEAPVMLVFYPRDFTPTCVKQLCDYRDHMDKFSGHHLQVFGISSGDVASHAKFAETHRFPFSLLSDPGHTTAKAYGSTSLLMLGRPTRAVYIINTKGFVLYRYLEPTIITYRSAEYLLKVIDELESHKLLP